MNTQTGAKVETEKSHRGVAAVDRALSIIAALEASNIPRNLSEISRTTGLYKSTILRILQSLQDAGYVMRVEDSKYALGPTIMMLGQAYKRADPLRHLVLPVMQRLVDEGSESPSFHIRQTVEERYCLFRLDSNHSTLDRVHAGDRLPVRFGAAGKVLLAFDETAHRSPDLNQIRQSCFAISLGERDEFCAGVAAPVFSHHNRLVGALSFSGPKERFGSADVEQMKKTMLAAAQELTAELGGAYPD